jgi:ATP-dependent Clp protease protease subunit
VDSYGGSVFAAAGIYNALKEHKGKVTVKIDGKAMSAASVIAMAGEEILMSPMAVMMIHNPWTMAQGDMRDLRKTADVLDTIKESIVNAYALKTGRSQDEIASMMDDETWMSANVAVREGFADEMLYNSPDEVMNSKGFDFNRLNVLNHTNKAIEKVMQFEKKDTKLHEARLRFLRMKGDRND